MESPSEMDLWMRLRRMAQEREAFFLRSADTGERVCEQPAKLAVFFLFGSRMDRDAFDRFVRSVMPVEAEVLKPREEMCDAAGSFLVLLPKLGKRPGEVLQGTYTALQLDEYVEWCLGYTDGRWPKRDAVLDRYLTAAKQVVYEIFPMAEFRSWKMSRRDVFLYCRLAWTSHVQGGSTGSGTRPDRDGVLTMIGGEEVYVVD